MNTSKLSRPAASGGNQLPPASRGANEIQSAEILFLQPGLTSGASANSRDFDPELSLPGDGDWRAFGVFACLISFALSVSALFYLITFLARLWVKPWGL
jgi:hypothetical protein